MVLSGSAEQTDDNPALYPAPLHPLHCAQREEDARPGRTRLGVASAEVQRCARGYPYLPKGIPQQAPVHRLQAQVHLAEKKTKHIAVYLSYVLECSTFISTCSDPPNLFRCWELSAKLCWTIYLNFGEKHEAIMISQFLSNLITSSFL